MPLRIRIVRGKVEISKRPLANERLGVGILVVLKSDTSKCLHVLFERM